MSTVTLDGNPIDVAGSFPGKGEAAKPFVLTGAGLDDKPLSAWDGKRKILNIIPSVDTGVCAASTRKFNEKASGLDNTVVLVISADLPFAAARFCGAEGLENVVTLSTFRSDSFRQDYGVAIENGPLRGLCARAVVVLDEHNSVIHSELVSETKNEPDYDSALAVL